MSLRIGIVCSFTMIVLDFSSSVSSIALLERKTQNRLFDILEIYIMCLGDIILPIASM